MAQSADTQTSFRCRRRTVLASLAGGATLVGASGAVGAATTPSPDEEVPQRVVVPAVPEFEDDYEGQFLVIFDPPAEPAVSGEEGPGECVPWPSERTRTLVGQLSDKRSEVPVAVQVPVSVDEQDANLVENAFMVIDDATPCQDGEYVRLDVEWITTRALVGKPPGPVAEEEGQAGLAEDAETPGGAGPGFGVIGAVLGLAGGLLARQRRRD